VATVLPMKEMGKGRRLFLLITQIIESLVYERAQGDMQATSSMGHL
jgi:hypothetical protein